MLSKKAKEYYIGIDLGGTNIKYLVREGKKVIYNYEKISKPTSNASYMKILHSVIDDVISKYGKENIKGIGIGSAGKITKSGKILYFKQEIKALRNLEVKKEVEKKYKIKTIIVNDSLPPYYAFKNKIKSENVLFLTLGTNMGSSIFVNGVHSYGQYFSDDIAYSLFKGVSFEYSISTRILLEKARKNKLKAKTPKDIYNLAKKNKDAKQIWKEYGEDIGSAITMISSKYKVDEVNISGGIANAKKYFLASLKKYVKENSNKKCPKIKVVKSKHEVGAYGASLMFE